MTAQPQDPAARRTEAVPLSQQVGLAIRAFRRSSGWSQRELARVVGVSPSTVARAELSADGIPVATVVRLLSAAGHALAVVDAAGTIVGEWHEADLDARDRGGRRFPAHRRVRTVRPGSLRPLWWTLHEYLAPGECGPQPRWTAEGFPVPDGTRYGKRPGTDGARPRWPHLSPELPQEERS